MNKRRTRRGFTQIVAKNQVILNRGLYRWAAPRSVFVRGLVNYRFQDLQRLPLSFINSVRGRCQIKFGMTTLLNNDGFTLIELLVVVLIIGILAAVALPQYQKAVEKSRATQAFTLLRSLAQAAESFYLSNGTWPTEFAELDIEIPWPSTEPTFPLSTDARANAEWSVEIVKSEEYNGLIMRKRNGRFVGCGFDWFKKHEASVFNNRWVCSEDLSVEAGSFCKKIFNGSYATIGSVRTYFL